MNLLFFFSIVLMGRFVTVWQLHFANDIFFSRRTIETLFRTNLSSLSVCGLFTRCPFPCLFTARTTNSSPANTPILIQSLKKKQVSKSAPAEIHPLSLKKKETGSACERWFSSQIKVPAKKLPNSLSRVFPNSRNLRPGKETISSIILGDKNATWRLVQILANWFQVPQTALLKLIMLTSLIWVPRRCLKEFASALGTRSTSEKAFLKSLFLFDYRTQSWRESKPFFKVPRNFAKWRFFSSSWALRPLSMNNPHENGKTPRNLTQPNST